MKSRLRNFLSLTLAGMLQFMPLLRSALPGLQAMASSPTGALMLRWVAGGVALFGYHAISSASSISISPPTATVGVAYSGTLTYSGGHSGSVSSMSISNTCLGSHAFASGLTITYGGGHTANISGTPTGASNNYNITLTAYDGSGCPGSGLQDTRSTAFTIVLPNGGNTVPTMTVVPQPVIAQVGSDVLLSGGAVGTPNPGYYWQKNLVTIPGATTNTLLISAAQMTNAGLYTLNASNSQGTATSFTFLTMAQTPGSNILTYQFTNYWPAGVGLTMTTLITNVSTGSNTYQWEYNNSPAGLPATPNLTFAPAAVTLAKSGTYTMNFNSTIAGTQVVSNQAYFSYWQFGYVPIVTNQPTGQTVSAGSNVTFNVTVCGTTPTLYWYQNGTTLVSSQLLNFNPASGTATTNASLTLNNVSNANAGNYTVVVSNAWGSVTSSNALLTVGASLSVSAPLGQTNYAGKNISLTVTPSGTAPFIYQWQKGGVNLSNLGNISGATTNALSFTPAAVSNSGNYAVIVTNMSGSVTSSVATLAILSVPHFAIAPTPTNITLSASGGVVGSNYVVQVSTNLANTNGWVPILTNAVLPGGVISLTDTNISSVQRFYRVQFP